MQCTENCFGCEYENFHWKIFDIFLIFAQNIDCGYTLEPPRRGKAVLTLAEAVLTSTHNLCFGAKIRKIPQFCCIKVGYKGVYITRTCFPDDKLSTGTPKKSPMYLTLAHITLTLTPGAFTVSMVSTFLPFTNGLNANTKLAS